VKEGFILKAVILAGGKGTRLRPLTYQNPKPMLPLVNRPFIYSFVSWLKFYGLKDIILSTCYLPEVFLKCFGDGSGIGVKLTYVTESAPLGTCGAVKNVEKYLDNGSFMVFNGDVLTSLNLKDMISFHRQKKADITISLVPVEDPTSYGLVPVDNESRVKEFLEKPNWEEITTNLINAGIYIIEPDVMKLVPSGENYSFERGLFPKALSKGYKIYGFESDSYWLDVGTPEKYLAAHHDILDKKINFEFPYREVFQNVYIGKEAKYSRENFTSGPVVVGEATIIEKGTKVLPLTVIGKNCYISSGCKISGCVIFDNCKIGNNCCIKDSIISRNVKIGENVKIEDVSVIGDGSIVGRDNVLKNGIKININSKITAGQITF